jgi:hypothetical protein
MVRAVWVCLLLAAILAPRGARAEHLPGIANLQRSLQNAATSAGSNSWNRIDRFQNVGTEAVELPGVEFLFLNPEELGFADISAVNAVSAQSAAIAAFPDFDFFGVSWWESGDSPQRTYTNSGTFMPLNVTLAPGEFFDLSTMAQFIGPGCAPCDAASHSELIVGWHFVAVPEPSAASLVAFGLTAIGWFRRRYASGVRSCERNGNRTCASRPRGTGLRSIPSVSARQRSGWLKVPNTTSQIALEPE